MNFFHYQEKARRNTTVLYLLFAVAVIAVVVSIDILSFWILNFYMAYQAQHSEQYRTTMVVDQSWTLLSITLMVLLIIALAMLYKIGQLRRGGSVIAEAMGGTRVAPSAEEPELRRLLNIVEEMAIASGTPVPRVYVIDEHSINAFAAGWSSNDAVVTVTRGCLRFLSRDELQGVIAHEFSHILNGDMQNNLRMVGLLHGILVIAMTGSMIMRAMRYSGHSRSRNSGNAVAIIFMIGMGLLVIGFVGSFFGGMIKAMVSREREYLADASAVQFTRQRDGIAGALKKIGGHGSGSTLSAAGAQEYSHAYFASGLHELFSTHPPLGKRIHRLDPRWDGNYPKTYEYRGEEVPAKSASPVQKQLKQTIATAILIQALSESGVGVEGVDTQNAAQQLAQYSPQLREACHNPFDARLLALAMLCAPESDRHHQEQVQWLNQQLSTQERLRLRQMMSMLNDYGRIHFVTLIDLSMPSLASLSNTQYAQFRQQCLDLVNLDQQMEFREWLLLNLILHRLDKLHSKAKPARMKYHALHQVREPMQQLLSFVAHKEHEDDDKAAEQAFVHAYQSLDLVADSYNADITAQQLGQALQQLNQLRAPIKLQLLTACAHVIEHDQVIESESFELIRIIAQRLDCPAPVLQV